MDNNLALLDSLHEDGSLILNYKSPKEEELARKIDQEIEEGERFAEQLHKVQHIEQEYRSQLIEIEKSQTRSNDDQLQIEQEYLSRLRKESEITNRFQAEIFNKTDPLETRNLTAELIKESKKKIVENALIVVCKNLACQSAAIFLFSKSGRLDRFGIRGWDREGTEISDDWFDDEGYEVGVSFTGRAAEPKFQGYGQIQIAEDLGKQDLYPRSRKEYEDKFGKLYSAIAIPLNGRNRTYGVLRIINKIDTTDKKRILKEPFSVDDARKLLSLSNYVATALSNFRRDVQSHILKHLSHLLINNSSNSLDSLRDVFQSIVDLLVQNPETAFQAAILRTKDRNGAFKHEASSLFDEVSKDRVNYLKVPNEAPIWMVPAKGKRLIIQDLQNSPLLSDFRNEKWARKNHFQSFGCFPLVKKNDVVGTLSIYTGRNYKFYPDAIAFLQSVADLLALFLFKLKQEELVRSVDTSARSQPNVPQGVEHRFQILAAEWKRETAAYPVLFDRLVHPSYQKIIGLGSAVVPIILKELKRNPDHWFWALEAIVGESPIQDDHKGIIHKMIDDWLVWGGNQGYVLE